jgi:fructosamine-3-kinase
VRIESRRALGGGDISQVDRLQTDAGPFVVKSHPSPPNGFFGAEAASLTALRASRTSLRIPEVVAVHDDRPAFLVLEDLGSGRKAADFDDAFGRGLAEVHRHGADRFGFDQQTYCGTTAQPNTWSDRWVGFYGEARLGHQLTLASRAGLLAAADGKSIDRLIERLDTLIDEPPEGPALVHGDLWAGNLLVASTGAPSLIDPSAYFAHREAEMGMMLLFGGFSTRVYAAYNEAFPLDIGWRERNPLYQLYHLLNHLNLFGGAYRAQVMGVVRRFV